jgi:hypothetical protein
VVKANQWRSGACLICLFTSAAASGWGQEIRRVEPITTDRPTAGPSPDLVPAGALQVETGVGLSLQRSVWATDLPETLLRVGITHAFEVRFLSSDLVHQSDPTQHEPSWQTTDVTASVKLLTGHANGLWPKSVILAVSFPTGGAAWTSGSIDPGFAATWTQTTHSGFFLNEVAQVTLTTDGHARRPLWSPSVATGRALSSRLTCFAEFAPSVLPDESVPSVTDGGFTYTPTEAQQIDLRVGFASDKAGQHTLLTAGYSFRRLPFLPGHAR